jgi:GNAT superfamily N-acetyltransferase
MAKIVEASAEDARDVRELLAEYAASLEADAQVCAASLEQELENPVSDGGMYAMPAGKFFLAREGSQIAGGVGVRFVGAGSIELRRLFVRPEFRGRQLGRWLAMAAIHEAGEMGSRRVVLETVPSMAAAQQLYEDLGFQDAGQRGAVRIMALELK